MAEWIPILVEPHTGGNVGAVCRALENLGLPGPRIVWERGRPTKERFWQEAERMAWGADQRLKTISIFDSLKAATEDLHLLWATLPKAQGPLDRIDSLEMGILSGSKTLPPSCRLGVLFGREHRGLTNEEIALAERGLVLPSWGEQPEYNLAQSVLLTGYVWKMLSEQRVSPPSLDGFHAPLLEVESFCKEARNLLTRLDYGRGTHPGLWLQLRHLVARARLSSKDIKLLRGILRRAARPLQNDAKTRKEPLPPILPD